MPDNKMVIVPGIMGMMPESVAIARGIKNYTVVGQQPSPTPITTNQPSPVLVSSSPKVGVYSDAIDADGRLNVNKLVEKHTDFGLTKDSANTIATELQSLGYDIKPETIQTMYDRQKLTNTYNDILNKNATFNTDSEGNKTIAGYDLFATSKDIANRIGRSKLSQIDNDFSFGNMGKKVTQLLQIRNEVEAETKDTLIKLGFGIDENGNMLTTPSGVNLIDTTVALALATGDGKTTVLQQAGYIETPDAIEISIPEKAYEKPGIARNINDTFAEIFSLGKVDTKLYNENSVRKEYDYEKQKLEAIYDGNSNSITSLYSDGKYKSYDEYLRDFNLAIESSKQEGIKTLTKNQFVNQYLGNQDTYVETVIAAQPTVLNLAKETGLSLIPVYGTIRNWNNMPVWGQVVSIAGDLLFVMPALGGVARAGIKSGVEVVTEGTTLASRAGTVARSTGEIAGSIVPRVSLSDIGATIRNPAITIKSLGSGALSTAKEVGISAVFPVKHPVATLSTLRDLATGKRALSPADFSRSPTEAARMKAEQEMGDIFRESAQKPPVAYYDEFGNPVMSEGKSPFRYVQETLVEPRSEGKLTKTTMAFELRNRDLDTRQLTLTTKEKTEAALSTMEAKIAQYTNDLARHTDLLETNPVKAQEFAETTLRQSGLDLDQAGREYGRVIMSGESGINFEKLPTEIKTNAKVQEDLNDFAKRIRKNTEQVYNDSLRKSPTREQIDIWQAKSDELGMKIEASIAKGEHPTYRTDLIIERDAINARINAAKINIESISTEAELTGGKSYTALLTENNTDTLAADVWQTIKNYDVEYPTGGMGSGGSRWSTKVAEPIRSGSALSTELQKAGVESRGGTSLFSGRRSGYAAPSVSVNYSAMLGLTLEAISSISGIELSIVKDRVLDYIDNQVAQLQLPPTIARNAVIQELYANPKTLTAIVIGTDGETQPTIQTTPDTIVQSQIATIIDTATGIATALATDLGVSSATNSATLVDIKTKVGNLVAPQVEAMIRTSTVPITKAESMVKLITRLVTDRVFRSGYEPTNIRTLPMIPNAYAPSKGRNLTQSELEASVGWKQGFMYRLKYPPYGENDTIYSREPIAGIQYHEGYRSAYESLTQLTEGKLPQTITDDMGAFKVSIKTPTGGNPIMDFDRKYDNPRGMAKSKPKKKGSTRKTESSFITW